MAWKSPFSVSSSFVVCVWLSSSSISIVSSTFTSSSSSSSELTCKRSPTRTSAFCASTNAALETASVSFIVANSFSLASFAFTASSRFACKVSDFPMTSAQSFNSLEALVEISWYFTHSSLAAFSFSSAFSARSIASLFASSDDFASSSSFSDVSSLCVNSFRFVSMLAYSSVCFAIAAFISVTSSSIELIFARASSISFVFSPFPSVNRSITLSKSSISSLDSALNASNAFVVPASFSSASLTFVFNFLFIAANSSRSRDTVSLDFFKFAISSSKAVTLARFSFDSTKTCCCSFSSSFFPSSWSCSSSGAVLLAQTLFPFFDGGNGSPVSASFPSSFFSSSSPFCSTFSFSGDARFFAAGTGRTTSFASSSFFAAFFGGGAVPTSSFFFFDAAALFSPFFNRCFGVP